MIMRTKSTGNKVSTKLEDKERKMSQAGDDTNEGIGERKAKKRALERYYYTQFQACARKSKRESKIKNDNDVIGLVVMIPASSFGVNWAKQTHGDDYLNIVYEGVVVCRHAKNPLFWKVRFAAQNGCETTFETIREATILDYGDFNSTKRCLDDTSPPYIPEAAAVERSELAAEATIAQSRPAARRMMKNTQKQVNDKDIEKSGDDSLRLFPKVVNTVQLEDDTINEKLTGQTECTDVVLEKSEALNEMQVGTNEREKSKRYADAELEYHRLNKVISQHRSLKEVILDDPKRHDARVVGPVAGAKAFDPPMAEMDAFVEKLFEPKSNMTEAKVASPAEDEGIVDALNSLKKTKVKTQVTFSIPKDTELNKIDEELTVTEAGAEYDGKGEAPFHEQASKEPLPISKTNDDFETLTSENEMLKEAVKLCFNFIKQKYTRANTYTYIMLKKIGFSEEKFQKILTIIGE